MFDSNTAVSTTCQALNFHITSFRPFCATTFNTVTSEHGDSQYKEQSHYMNEAFAVKFDTWCPNTENKICDLETQLIPLEQNN